MYPSYASTSADPGSTSADASSTSRDADSTSKATNSTSKSKSAKRSRAKSAAMATADSDAEANADADQHQGGGVWNKPGMSDFTDWITNRTNYERLTRKGQKVTEMHKAIANYVNSKNPGFSEQELWDEALAKGRLSYAKKNYRLAIEVSKKTGAGDKPGKTLLQQMQVHVPQFERYDQVFGNSLSQNSVDPYETLVLGDTHPLQPQDSDSEPEQASDLSSIGESDDVTDLAERQPTPLSKTIRGVVEARDRGRARKRAKRGQIPESIEQAITSLNASSAGQDEQLIDARNERSWLNDEKVGFRVAQLAQSTEKEKMLQMQQDLMQAQRELFADQRNFMKEKEVFLQAKAQFKAEKALFEQKFGREVVVTDEQVVYRNVLK
ncbi:hypothetical protein BGZ54_000778 [Gamsiella multidivaricata]|nr:hypothetical protein BGZ54_000778 [Gamsiella multidivaricata]